MKEDAKLFDYSIFKDAFTNSYTFHEFTVDFGNKNSSVPPKIFKVQSDKLKQPPLSVLTLNFRKMMMGTKQADSQEVPIIIQATYLFKNNSKLPESHSKTFIIGREVNRKNPFMNQKLDI